MFLLFRNYFWVNRAYKMSRLNSDNKLKFGKRSLKKKKRKLVLSPLNFTKQVFIRPQENFTEASPLSDSDLEEKMMEDTEEETDNR